MAAVSKILFLEGRMSTRLRLHAVLRFRYQIMLKWKNVWRSINQSANRWEETWCCLQLSSVSWFIILFLTPSEQPFFIVCGCFRFVVFRLLEFCCNIMRWRSAWNIGLFYNVFLVSGIQCSFEVTFLIFAMGIF